MSIHVLFLTTECRVLESHRVHRGGYIFASSLLSCDFCLLSFLPVAVLTSPQPSRFSGQALQRGRLAAWTSAASSLLPLSPFRFAELRRYAPCLPILLTALRLIPHTANREPHTVFYTPVTIRDNLLHRYDSGLADRT